MSICLDENIENPVLNTVSRLTMLVFWEKRHV